MISWKKEPHAPDFQGKLEIFLENYPRSLPFFVTKKLLPATNTKVTFDILMQIFSIFAIVFVLL